GRGNEREGFAQPGEGRRQGRDEGDETRDAEEPNEEEGHHETLRRDRERPQLAHAEGLVEAAEHERQHDPAEQGDGAGEHRDRPRDIRCGERQRDHADHDADQDHETPERPEDHGDEHPRTPQEPVREQAEAEPQEVCNHDGPSCWRRPPTSSTKRSSSEDPARTSSVVPAASTRPAPITATWSHIRSTRSIEWLETMTVPPPRTNWCRMSRMFAAETGSTDSKGSSSTSSLGAWMSAQASAIFFVMPAE